VRQDLESSSPESSWTLGFILFYCQWEEYVSAQRFWREQVSLGKETGLFSLWLIAIFGEHVGLLLSALQSPHSLIALTVVRNRDNEVYSVTASH
jgi:hypothetical protein